MEIFQHNLQPAVCRDKPISFDSTKKLKICYSNRRCELECFATANDVPFSFASSESATHEDRDPDVDKMA